ncbi:MAG: hypothetical protein H8F28_21490, partial [Fibrella sp.]|nr:hypothetical protein [Armatimonadota bacterium]
MKNIVSIGITATFSSGFVCAPCAAQDVSSLPGWKTEQVGSSVRLTPRDLPAGALFELTVEAPTRLGGESPAGWLESRVGQEVKRLGTTTDAGRAVPLDVPQGELFSLVRTVRLASGESRLLTGFAARRSDGQTVFVRIISSPEEAVYKQYLPGAIRGIVALARGGRGAETKVAKNPEKKTPANPRRPKGSAAYTRVGAGVSTSAIVGIYTRIASQMGYGGMLTLNNLPTVVFKDGTFYEDYDVPLADFDVAAARRERPNAWGKWRKQGGVIQILSEKRGWEKAEWLGPFPGAKPGEKLSGRYFSFSGGGDTALGGGTAYGVE